jgi:hypothetical protein
VCKFSGRTFRVNYIQILSGGWVTTYGSKSYPLRIRREQEEDGSNGGWGHGVVSSRPSLVRPESTGIVRI